MLKTCIRFAIAPLVLVTATLAHAAQLSTDARSAIPEGVQQLVVIDYRAMQNSTAAMDLRNRVMPPELKQFDDALRKSALADQQSMDQYVDDLAFALFRPAPDSDALMTVGIAQGQFPTQDILASFHKQKLKATLVRSNSIYPMTKTGMVLCFVDPSTMIFGDKDAVTKALDARDGVIPNLLSNSNMMNAMQSVDTNPLWSILDDKGTQTMMRQLLGEAGSATDFETVRKRLQASWYSMDFQHGVKFALTISTGDPFAAATLSSLMTAAVMVRKMTSTDAEKEALNDTSISSSAGNLNIAFASTDSEFSSLLHSPLFQTMVR
ncbi:MAG TPA: hypothetical protein VL991_02475 [Terracidiphilus sp.]|nr:hypothetical protein [Terracidiphilus sp.]